MPEVKKAKSKKSQFALLTVRRFLPLFLTQFLGAFNDNFFKSALLMLITFRLADSVGLDPRVLVNAAAAVFILPFFVFASVASGLADKYDKSLLMRWVKFAEIVVMSGALVGFLWGNLWLLLLVLFLMGAQSAFFSPAKYSILPQHLPEEELIAGNGLIQMGTYLAILSGTIAGGLLILTEYGGLKVGCGAVAIAAAGWVSSWYIPPTKPINPDLRVSGHLVKRTCEILSTVTPHRDVMGAMLSISWFWLVGATFLAQFPTYARLVLGAGEDVATALLAIFSLGIGFGSTACDTLLKGKVTAKYVPVSAIIIALASVVLWWVSDRPVLGDLGSLSETELLGVKDFFMNAGNLAIVACLFTIAFAGGLYIVPLYAIMQNRAPEALMSSVVACSNITDSIFMALSGIGAGFLIAMGCSIPQIFFIMGPTTFIVALLIRKYIRD